MDESADWVVAVEGCLLPMAYWRVKAVVGWTAVERRATERARKEVRNMARLG